MDNIDFSIPNTSKEKEKSEPNPSNINSNPNNYQIVEKNIEEIEENDNLGYNSGINFTNFNNNNYIKRLDSKDSPIRAKFSIDLPNVPKQRLHEYLNEDLLNAIEYSPQIPTLNSGLNNIKNENNNSDNNPNKLYGFSLYPSNLPQTNNNTISNKNINYIPEYHPNQQGLWSQNNNNIINSNFPNIINNNTNFNNYNYNINYIGIPNTNNNTNNLISPFINNIPIFIPKQLRNKEYQQKNISLINEKNDNFNNNNEKKNSKNKFDNNKKNGQFLKKEGKLKKPFEVRVGDWTCNKCSNLNFSFRNKCNRCGLPKEISEKYSGELMNQDMINQNMNFNFPNDGKYE